MAHVVPFHSDAATKGQHASSIRRVVGGLLYLVGTLVCSWAHLVLLQPSVANDYWWPQFNATGLQTYVADTFNTHLTQSRSGRLSLLSRAVVSTKSYASASARVEWSASYGRHHLLGNVSLAAAIASMRSNSLDRTLSMASAYCWVDLNRTFAMALTFARQRRCDAPRHRENAALYFEPVVRNSPPNAMATSGLSQAINATVLEPLGLTSDGQRWIHAMESHSWLAVPDEMAVWVAQGLTTWKLPLQNLNHDGIEDSIEIQNAFGYRQSMRIKKFATLGRGLGSWTTLNANCGIWNIMNTAFSIGGSVVLYANNSFPSLGIDWDADILGPPYTPGTSLVRQHIGPFLAIDIYLIQVPPALAAFHRHFQEHLGHTLLATSLPVVVDPAPPDWVAPDRVFYGGNPVCPFGRPEPFIQLSFGYYDDCSKTQRHTISLTIESVLFAMQFETLSPDNVHSVCSLCIATSQECKAFLPAAPSAVAEMLTADPSTISALRHLVHSRLNVTFMQMASSQAQPSPFILSQPLVSAVPDDPWSVFGWTMVYEWLQGSREVLTFEGDQGAMTLITQPHADLSMAANPTELPQDACQFVWWISLYVSVVLTGIGVLVMAYAAATRFNFEGANLLQFNQVVGSVWLGRPVLFLRGFTALVVLSTSPVAFVRSGAVSTLELHPRSWLASCVLAGEGTWIIYVVHDFLLPLTGRRTASCAPWSTLATWLSIVLLDVLSPIEATATIDPICTITRLGLSIQCSSGTVEIGSTGRLAVLTGLCVGVPCAVLAVVGLVKPFVVDAPSRPRMNEFLIPASASAFCLDMSAANSADPIVSLMSGIIPMGTSAFDIKLWRVFDMQHMAQISVRPPPSAGPWLAKAATAGPRSLRVGATTRVLGFVYMVATVMSGYSYLVLTESIMANDLGWESFNATGHLSFLVGWFSDELQVMTSSMDGQVDSPQHGDVSTHYASNQTFLILKSIYPSLIQDDVNTVEAVVASLRRMDSCLMPWISTTPCFVDFDRVWELAPTAARQRQCATKERTNGAVYLESWLRNAHWPSLMVCWGDALNVGVIKHVVATAAGHEWLGRVQGNAMSVDDEVLYWLAHNITRFVTQWQNYKSIGITETFDIQNAFGRAHPFTMQKRDPLFQLTSPTSFKMQWPLAKLLEVLTTNASGVAGMSLVRSSSSFAFANATVEDLLLRHGTVTAPWTEAMALTRSTFGPFGSVVLRRVPPPATLKTVMATLKAAMLAVLGTNASALAQYEAIPFTSEYYPQPTPWSGLRHVGGDVMCDVGINIAPQVSLFFMPDGTCSVNGCDQIIVTRLTVLVAAVALGSQLTASSASTICTHETASSITCALALALVDQFLSDAVPRDHREHLGQVAASAKSTLQSMVHLVQFTQTTREAPVALLSYGLFDEPSFDFFSWLYLFEWLLGQREVVQFDGPHGALTVLSGGSLKTIYQVNAQEIPRNVAFYVRCTIQYFTFVLLCVAALVCVSIVANRGHIEGLNMLEFNRVAGLVWIGRPLMALRGVAAVGILSTSRLILARPGHGEHVHVASIPPDVLTTLLSSGEIGWVVYILNDVFSVVTRDLTSSYAYKSSALTWLVVAIWSEFVPVQHVVHLHRECTLDAVDTAMTCHNGVFEVGRFDRFVGLLLVACGCCVVTFVADRARRRDDLSMQKRHESIYSPLVHATAQHQFDRSRWEWESVYYMDRASAVLNGLLAIRIQRDKVAVLDIKTWRVFVMHHNGAHDAMLPVAWKYAIPLEE